MCAPPTLNEGSPYIVGLTGGIGCGKTTIAACFARKNIAIIDADVIAHQLTAANGAVIKPIKEAFGNSVIAADGSLNRQVMRARVFQDANEKLRLETILHPAIRNEIDRQIQQYSPNSLDAPQLGSAGSPTMSPAMSRYVLLVVPLLFESMSYRNMVMRTLVIDCPQSVQIERVVQRSAGENAGERGDAANVMSAEDVRRIIANQIPRALRLQLADDVIFNDKTVSAPDVVVEILHQRYLTLSKLHLNLAKT